MVFVPHNLLNNPPFISMNLVCCRNLMIFLRRDTKRLLLSQLHRSLNYPHGFLILGNAEQTGTGTETIFAAVHDVPHAYRPMRGMNLASLERPWKWSLQAGAPRPTDSVSSVASELLTMPSSMPSSSGRLPHECIQLLRSMLNSGIGIAISSSHQVLAVVVPPDTPTETKRLLKEGAQERVAAEGEPSGDGESQESGNREQLLLKDLLWPELHSQVQSRLLQMQHLYRQKSGDAAMRAESRMLVPAPHRSGETVSITITHLSLDDSPDPTDNPSGTLVAPHGSSDGTSSESSSQNMPKTVWVLVLTTSGTTIPDLDAPAPLAAPPPAAAAPAAAVPEGAIVATSASGGEATSAAEEPLRTLRWIINNICAPAYLGQMRTALESISEQLAVAPSRRPGKAGRSGGHDSEVQRGLEDEVIKLRNDVLEQQRFSEASRQSLDLLQDRYVAAHEELQATNEELQSTNEELFIVNAEHRLRISELIELNASHEHLMVSSQVAMVSLTQNYLIERFTAAAQRWLDWQPSDVGRSINQLRTTPLLRTIKQAVDTINEMGGERTFFFREAVADGGNHYEVQARRHTQTASIVITAFDITEMKTAQAEQRRVADDLTLLIDTANAPIFGIDGNFLVNEWNRKAAEITGFSRAEVMGKDLVKTYITSEFQDSVRSVLVSALAGTQTDNYEFPLYTKDGERVEVLLNATTRKDATGKIVGVVGVGQNITEMKAAQLAKARWDIAELEIEKQKAVSEAKDLFLASMSHEIRTPLSSLLGLLSISTDAINSLTSTSTESMTEPMRKLSMCHQAGMHLLNLVNDVLDFSKIAAGKLTLEMTPCSLGELCRSIVQMAATLQVANEGVALELEVADGIPEHVLVDEQRLRQVLINLLHNGLKFTYSGTVGLRVELLSPPTGEKAHIRFAVFDTGVGICEADQPNIFTAFTQVARQHTSVHGAGLGLSICKELVAMMGSTLQLSSRQAPDANPGSTFFWEMSLDITYASAPSATAIGGSPQFASPVSTTATIGSSPLGVARVKEKPGATMLPESEFPQSPPAMAPFLGKVVLIEDDPLNQIVTSYFLVDYHREIIANGLEAIVRIHACLASESPCWGSRKDDAIDCCVMDFNMPFLSGNEVAHLARSMAHWHPYAAMLPILGATTHALASEHEKCIVAGMDSCLTKPFNKARITQAVDELIGRMHDRQVELQLSDQPPHALRGGAGVPDSEATLALQRKLASLLASALVSDARDRGKANAPAAAPATSGVISATGGSKTLNVDPAAFLATLRWVCSVLGAHEAVALCDALASPTVPVEPASGWEQGRRGKASSPVDMLARYTELQSAVLAHDARIATMGYQEVAARAAVHVPTLSAMPARSATHFVAGHASLIADLNALYDDCLKHGNWEEYHRRTHSFKSGARWIGANHCGDTAEALESAARKGQAQLVKLFHERLVVDLQAAFEGIELIREDGIIPVE